MKISFLIQVNILNLVKMVLTAGVIATRVSDNPTEG
jgi:hypothetical protein